MSCRQFIRTLLLLAVFGVLGPYAPQSQAASPFPPKADGCCAAHGGESAACTANGYRICNDGFSSPACLCSGSENFLLTVSRSGAGSGAVVGSGINCGNACVAIFAAGESVTLTATPDIGSAFAGWSGGCGGANLSCTFNMYGNRSVSAAFDVAAPTSFPLTVSKTGPGTGTVTGSGIACGNDCFSFYPTGTNVTLTATAAPGSVFLGWSGSCTASTGPCSVALTAERGVVASFGVVAAGPNYQGLYWASPAGAEPGRGVNVAHQGDTIFATWFTNGQDGKPLWMAASADLVGPGVYSGDLFIATGPAFNAVPFNPGAVVETTVGTATFSFSDVDNGIFTYTINPGTTVGAAVTQAKSITKQVFGPLPTCSWGTQPNLALATNYQDMWWAVPPGSQAGWGINFSHQGDIIFATWFTFDATGKPWWLAFVATRVAPGVYSGNVFTTTGPAFQIAPYSSSTVVETTIGSATLTFTDGNNATFAYAVNGVSQSKAITRQVFVPPGTTCH